MFLRFDRRSGRWVVPFAHHNAEAPAEGDAAEQGGAPDTAKLAAENAALKKRLEEITPRLSAVEEAEKRRAEKVAREADERRKKEVGVEKVLEEKDTALKAAQARIEEIEARERARVDAEFSALPEKVRRTIEPLKEKLGLSDWSDVVEKHREMADEGEGDGKRSMFFQPGGGASSQGYQPTRKAQEILAQVGRGSEMMSKLHAEQVIDEDTKQRVTRFTRPLNIFFSDMQKPERYKVKISK